MKRRFDSPLLSAVALTFVIAACGDDGTTGSDTGTPPADSGTSDTGGGDSAADTGGGGDATAGVPIPPILAECATTSCMAGATGIAYLAYISPDCSAVFSDTMMSTVTAGRGAPYACADGTCTSNSDDGPDPWEDESESVVSTIPAGSYGITAWFDHDGNILMGGGPDTGDTVCCFDSPVDASTTSLTVRTGGCIDL
jgi:hypothetical protein